MSSFPKKKVAPLLKKKLLLSEEVEKGTNILNDMEEPVHMIHRKDLGRFKGKSTVSTRWINLDHECLEK